MKIASLDLGTNTFLLLIGEIDRLGKVHKVADYHRVIRLGQSLGETGRIHPDAFQRAEACFVEFSNIIEQHNVDHCVAVGTSAARDAKNGAEFIALGQKYKIKIHIIAGLEEAKLTYEGCCEGQIKSMVIDIGGGSTEIIGTNSEDKLTAISLDLGSVRLQDQFRLRHPTSGEELENLRIFIDNKLEDNRDALLKMNREEMVGVAGTPTMLAAMEQQTHFENANIENFIINQSSILSWVTKLSKMNLDQRLKIVGMQAGREDLIISGAMILTQVLKFFNCENLKVSSKGVRFGLAKCWENYV